MSSFSQSTPKTPPASVKSQIAQNKCVYSLQLPGYRTYELHPNGVYTTHVNRVTERIYDIDLVSDGY